MPTPYTTLVHSFLTLIEKDKAFFNYFELTDEESEELAKVRSLHFLNEAANRLILEGHPSVDFSNRDDEQFNFELTPQELIILPSLMYQQYLFRDFSYLKTLSVNYTSTDMRVFDPSNARSTFLNIYNTVCEENARMIDIYKNSDRTTGELLTINFASYDTED